MDIKKIENVKNFHKLQTEMILENRRICPVLPGDLWISKSKNSNGFYDIVLTIKRSIEYETDDIIMGGEYWSVIKNGNIENFFWEGELYLDYSHQELI